MDAWKERELRGKIDRIRFEIWTPTPAEWKELSQNPKLLGYFIDECQKAIGDCEETLDILWDDYDFARRRSEWQPKLKRQAKQLGLQIKKKECKRP